MKGRKRKKRKEKGKKGKGKGKDKKERRRKAREGNERKGGETEEMERKRFRDRPVRVRGLVRAALVGRKAPTRVWRCPDGTRVTCAFGVALVEEDAQKSVSFDPGGSKRMCRQKGIPIDPGEGKREEGPGGVKGQCAL